MSAVNKKCRVAVTDRRNPKYDNVIVFFDTDFYTYTPRVSEINRIRRGLGWRLLLRGIFASPTYRSTEMYDQRIYKLKYVVPAKRSMEVMSVVVTYLCSKGFDV